MQTDSQAQNSTEIPDNFLEVITENSARDSAPDFAPDSEPDFEQAVAEQQISRLAAEMAANRFSRAAKLSFLDQEPRKGKIKASEYGVGRFPNLTPPPRVRLNRTFVKRMDPRVVAEIGRRRTRVRPSGSHKAA